MQETVRSVVKAWELDALAHFTTAYYYRALSTATMSALELLGHRSNVKDAPWTVFSWTKFIKELRAGDAYHIETGLVGSDGSSTTLGHRLFNSETGDLCTTFLQRLNRAPIETAGLAPVEWPDQTPERNAVVSPKASWQPTSATTLRPEDLDASGRLDLSALIHFCSDANIQLQNTLGMTSSYMRDNRIGYSTAEYQLRLHAEPPKVCTALEVMSTVAHLGRSSLWFVHEMRDASAEVPVATLTQMGVHLDLEARRSAAVPELIRERATALMAGGLSCN